MSEITPPAPIKPTWPQPREQPRRREPQADKDNKAPDKNRDEGKSEQDHPVIDDYA